MPGYEEDERVRKNAATGGSWDATPGTYHKFLEGAADYDAQQAWIKQSQENNISYSGSSGNGLSNRAKVFLVAGVTFGLICALLAFH